jgi:hypothetical protein
MMDGRKGNMELFRRGKIVKIEKQRVTVEFSDQRRRTVSTQRQRCRESARKLK